MNERKLPVVGLHHVALSANHYSATRNFYISVMQMEVEWEPDSDNVYLTSGRDNLAIHRALEPASSAGQRLDHIGLVVPRLSDVDLWFEHLQRHNVEIVALPRTHRDGARSCYCLDPEGTKIQIICHPPLSSTPS